MDSVWYEVPTEAKMQQKRNCILPVQCSSFLTPRNQNYVIWRVRIEYEKCEVTGNSLKWKLRYCLKGTLFSKCSSLATYHNQIMYV